MRWPLINIGWAAMGGVRILWAWPQFACKPARMIRHLAYQKWANRKDPLC
jgi:hypothetical protein